MLSSPWTYVTVVHRAGKFAASASTPFSQVQRSLLRSHPEIGYSLTTSGRFLRAVSRSASAKEKPRNSRRG